MPPGLKVTLSPIPHLTVDQQGHKLLEDPFVFQCGPLDSYRVQHNYSFGNYDTIEDGQFARQGGRQLATWQFDTLVMYLGVTEDGTSRTPSWVPFPTREDGSRQFHTPQWYAQQVADLHDSGAPFHYSAVFDGAPEGTVHHTKDRTKAVLLGFAEVHRGGEGDAIYLEAVSFSEWRDPTITERALGSGASGGGAKSAHTLPTTVRLLPSGVCVTITGLSIPPRRFATGRSGGAGIAPVSNTNPCTLADLAKHFYHDPSEWRSIASANDLSGIGPNTSMLKSYPHIPARGLTIRIPEIAPESAEPVSSHLQQRSSHPG